MKHNNLTQDEILLYETWKESDPEEAETKLQRLLDYHSRADDGIATRIEELQEAFNNNAVADWILDQLGTETGNPDCICLCLGGPTVAYYIDQGAVEYHENGQQAVVKPVPEDLALAVKSEIAKHPPEWMNLVGTDWRHSRAL